MKSCGMSGRLLVPPLVVLHMLFVLNHHKLGDTVMSLRSLQDLHTLMHSDDRIWVIIQRYIMAVTGDMPTNLWGLCRGFHLIPAVIT